MTKPTKKAFILAIVFTILSFLLTIGPALYYTVSALITSTLIVQQAALLGTVFIALIGSLICLISKTFTFRSRIWIFLLVLYFCITNFTTMIIIFAATQIVDELIFAPIARHYRNKFTINKQIDKRGI